MTDRNKTKLVAENESGARRIWALIKDHPLFPVLGGFTGAALYGATIVLTGAPAGIMGTLISIGIGIVAGTACKVIADTIQKPVQSEQDNVVQEEQIVALDTYARSIQTYGLDMEKALFLVRLSQFYWVGTTTEWQNIKKNFKLSAPLNTCPEDEMDRVMVVYTVKAHNKPIRFSKGGIMGFFQNYAPHAQGEKGLLYAFPDMEGNIMTYGFKSE